MSDFVERVVAEPVVAAKRRRPGLAHVTVVPTNFDREETTCPFCGEPLPGR